MSLPTFERSLRGPLRRHPERTRVDSHATLQALQENIERVIKGKAQAVELSVVCLLANGHLLIEDVPGVGKTTLAQSLARSLDCAFQRIQFTSDLLPTDILGVSIYNQETHAFEFKPGPLFANIILADEMNRTTPKTQSALLEAMNDAQVTVEHVTHRLPLPFMVIATQNPMEYAGTYPLPESQLDRFLMRISLGYPAIEDEKRILNEHGFAHPLESLSPTLNASMVLDLQKQVEQIRMDESLTDYLLSIVQATRESDMLSLGVSPRGALALFRTSRALALVRGRSYCLPDDIKSLAPFVFSHRVVMNLGQDTGGDHTQQAIRVIQAIVDEIPVPL